jgi:hypothetical protein
MTMGIVVSMTADRAWMIRAWMIRRSTMAAATMAVAGMTEVLRRRVFLCLVDFREFDLRR